MNRDEMVQLFREKAKTIGKDHETQNDMILQLAELLAGSKGRLSKENFDVLVNIGALMYKDGLAKFRARSEVASTMRESHKARDDPACE